MEVERESGGKKYREKEEKKEDERKRRDSVEERLEGNGNLIIHILLCLTGAFTNTTQQLF